MKHSRSTAIACVLLFAAAGFLAGYATAPKAHRLVGASAGSPASRQSAGGNKGNAAASSENLPAVAQRMITNLSSAARLEDFFDSLLAWSANDPEAALAFAMEHMKLRRQERAVGAILGEWTKRDPESAWSWTTNKTANNPQYVDAVLSQLGKTDGAKAWQFATAFAADHTNAARSTSVGALRGMTYAGDYENAARLLQEDKVLSTQDRTAVSSLLIASQWGLNDPEKAVAWAKGLAEDDPIRSRVLAELGIAWAQVDPAKAADYAVQLPPGQARQEVLSRAVDNWIDGDTATVGEWLNQLPSSPDFDEAIKRLATHPKVAENPATAMGWAHAITDRELRIQASTKIIYDWMQREPAAALAYLNNSTDMPAEIRNEVRGRVENGDLYSSGKDE